MNQVLSIPCAVEGGRLGPGCRLARMALHRALARLKGGTLTVIEAWPDGETSVFGTHATGGADPLHGTLILREASFYRMLAFGGHLSACERFIAGGWDSPNLPATLQLLASNQHLLDGLEKGFFQRIANTLASAAYRLFQSNTVSGSRKNIMAHYDLGNDFFALVLDETMAYSCALFETPQTPLHQAQLAKLDRLIDKLGLDASQHLVEIGSGWGGLAIRAAQRTGCRVTSITVSPAQHAEASRRVAQAGLAGRVSIVLEDYRRLAPPTGGFDKCVSVEMVEAVGHAFLPEYFAAIGRLLKPSGLAVIQAITVPDRRYDKARDEVDFIKKYVFPGCCIPSAGALSWAAARQSDLSLTHLEDFTPHYAATLMAWRSNLFAMRDRILALGYPETLIRLWDLYLSYCAAGFEARTIGLVQTEWRRAGCIADPLVPARNLAPSPMPWTLEANP